MADERVAGTLFVDMKYVFLYHKLGFKEITTDVHQKNYGDIVVTIESERQQFMFKGRPYPLTRHRDFVILELLDALLLKGYDAESISIVDCGITIAGPFSINIRCEQWGKDYEKAACTIVLNIGNAIYTSRLSGGLIDREYKFNINGKIQDSGLLDNKEPFDFTPLKTTGSKKYPSEFNVSGNILIEYLGKDEIVDIPEGITKIESGAFWNNCIVKRINLPESIKVIGGDAFAYCYNLEFTNIPSNTIDIGDDPYAGCTKLILRNDSSEFILDNGVLFTKDMTRLIHYTPSLPADNYEIPETVNWIGKHSFYNCNNLHCVIIGRNVDYIGNNPFSDCHNIVLDNRSPNFVYEDGALMDRNRLTIIHYSHGRKESEYIMPDTVRTIGRNSFWNSKRIEKITLGKNLRQIGYNPFANCSNLIITSNSSNYVVVDGILYDSTLREVVCCTDAVAKKGAVLQETVENIGRNSFAGCTSMKSIVIPDSVKTISRGAFSNCESLTDVYVPDSVELIEKWAFSYCTSLRSISINKNTKLNAETFAGSKGVEVKFR